MEMKENTEKIKGKFETHSKVITKWDEESIRWNKLLKWQKSCALEIEFYLANVQKVVENTSGRSQVSSTGFFPKSCGLFVIFHAMYVDNYNSLQRYENIYFSIEFGFRGILFSKWYTLFSSNF